MALRQDVEKEREMAIQYQQSDGQDKSDHELCVETERQDGNEENLHEQVFYPCRQTSLTNHENLQ